MKSKWHEAAAHAVISVSPDSQTASEKDALLAGPSQDHLEPLDDGDSRHRLRAFLHPKATPPSMVDVVSLAADKNLEARLLLLKGMPFPTTFGFPDTNGTVSNSRRVLQQHPL